MKPLKDWIEQDLPEIKKVGMKEYNNVNFHRDPIRPQFIDAGYFFSPADGTVLYTKLVQPDEEIVEIKGKPFTLKNLLNDELFSLPCLVIGIFLSQYDVHIARLPYGGFVTYKKLPKIMTMNRPMLTEERNILRGVIDYDAMEYAFENERYLDKIYNRRIDYTYYIVSIADKEVDVVSHFFESGKNQLQNSRLASIRWGSQIDLVLPVSDKFMLDFTVPVLHHVEAGLDPVVRIKR